MSSSWLEKIRARFLLGGVGHFVYAVLAISELLGAYIASKLGRKK